MTEHKSFADARNTVLRIIGSNLEFYDYVQNIASNYAHNVVRSFSDKELAQVLSDKPGLLEMMIYRSRGTPLTVDYFRQSIAARIAIDIMTTMEPFKVAKEYKND